jgi:hypothetical protein
MKTLGSGPPRESYYMENLEQEKLYSPRSVLRLASIQYIYYIA